MKAALRFAFVAAIRLAAASAAGAQQSWVGKTIFTKKNGIKIGPTGDDGKQVYVAELTSINYKVLGDKDGWLQVNDGRGNTGWFDTADAVVLDDAPAFFSERLRQNANDLGAYYRRATAWKFKGEFDIAIKDYGEALRVDPQAPIYNGRGNAWLGKKDYDKAIADFNEAIRLDPKLYTAYVLRGLALAD
jgi:tetratricopeptide (TPR) repeat protein